jgi:hypothetical protein
MDDRHKQKFLKQRRKTADSEPEAYRKYFQWVIFTYTGREYYELFILGGSYFHSFLNDRQKQL